MFCRMKDHTRAVEEKEKCFLHYTFLFTHVEEIFRLIDKGNATVDLKKKLNKFV